MKGNGLMRRLSTLTLAASVILPLTYAAADPDAPRTRTMLTSCRRTRALLTCALLLLPAAHAAAQPRSLSHRPRAPAAVRVVAADIFDAMYFKERADSDITPAALAAYGNSLVARRGLDFWFDACPVVRANKNPRPAREVSETSVAYAYALRRVGGGRVNFQLISDTAGPGGGMCAECFFHIPALRVTRGRMLVVASGRRYLLERPRGFLLHEVSLVDESRRGFCVRGSCPSRTSRSASRLTARGSTSRSRTSTTKVGTTNSSSNSPTRASASSRANV